MQSHLCLDVIISGSGFSFRGDSLSGSDKSTHSLGRVTIHPIPCQNIILPLSGKDNRCLLYIMGLKNDVENYLPILHTYLPNSTQLSPNPLNSKQHNSA